MIREPLREEAPVARPLEAIPTGDLVSQLFRQTGDLVRKELELAKAEIRTNVRSVAAMSAGYAAAAVCGLLGLGLLAAAAVLALANVMAPWLAAFAVGVLVLAIGFALGAGAKSKRPARPLERTQKTLKEDVRWAKERIA